MASLPRLADIPQTPIRPASVPRRDLEVRLAPSPAEIDAAQALRYRVFYEEMGAHPTAREALERRDRDSFDAHCDHLLIIDHERGRAGDAVVATYRLLRRSQAARHGGFYTATEFDIASLLAYPGEILELGRSCVETAYRTGAIMQVMWRGIAHHSPPRGTKAMVCRGPPPGTGITGVRAAPGFLPPQPSGFPRT